MKNKADRKIFINELFIVDSFLRLFESHLQKNWKVFSDNLIYMRRIHLHYKVPNLVLTFSLMDY